MTTPNDNSGKNPAWKPFLDVLPESLHNLVIPVLKEWDAGVQQKFQDIRNEYSELENYKQFAENNIDPEYIKQSVMLADALEREPAKVVSQINEAWKLGYVSKEEAEKLGQASQSGAEDDFFNNGDPENDIFKDPRVKAMKEALEQLQEGYQTDKQREEEEAAIKQFEEELDQLEQSYTDPSREGGPLPFDRLVVTALISQGIDPEAAVKRYHEALAANGAVEPPANESGSGSSAPVVMGNEGTAGSGTSDGAVDVTSLSRSDVNATVEQMLARAQESGN